jgi:hypothetical protein
MANLQLVKASSSSAMRRFWLCAVLLCSCASLVHSFVFYSSASSHQCTSLRAPLRSHYAQQQSCRSHSTDMTLMPAATAVSEETLVLDDPTTAVTTVQTQSSTNVMVRKAEWQDLGAASRLLVTEFYGQTVWYPAQCLSELNRLQLNFHFNSTRHLMLVATDPLENTVVGFADVDGRELPAAKRHGKLHCSCYTILYNSEHNIVSVMIVAALAGIPLFVHCISSAPYSGF